jgi:PE family
VADGYEVDPEALRTASGGFHAGADAVGQAARQLSTAQLVPGALGEVDAAYELAAAFADFAGRHADDFQHGSAWVSDTANGLVTNADSYTRAEDFRP